MRLRHFSSASIRVDDLGRVVSVLMACSLFCAVCDFRKSFSPSAGEDIGLNKILALLILKLQILIVYEIKATDPRIAVVAEVECETGLNSQVP